MGLSTCTGFILRSLDCLWYDVKYPMEPWELESSLALRQLDRLGRDKADYLTLESGQQQTSGNFYYLSLISFHLQHFSSGPIPAPQEYTIVFALTIELVDDAASPSSGSEA